MGNLKNRKVIWFKAALFLLLGLLSGALLIWHSPTLTSAILLGLTVWAFCRAYYFAFYVIERYVDPSFQFAGLLDFACYTLFGRTPEQRKITSQQ
jgi:hypothetical protein